MKRTVAGIDPSLTSTGVALLYPDSNDQSRVQSKGRKTDTTDMRADRLLLMSDRIVAHVARADLAVIESPAYGNTMGSMHDRSGLWWLIVSELCNKGIPVLEVAPTARAKYATGRGNAGKDEVLAAVVRRYPQFDVTGNDVADAVVLAAIGARLLGEPIDGDMPQANLSALDKLVLPEGVK